MAKIEDTFCLVMGNVFIFWLECNDLNKTNNEPQSMTLFIGDAWPNKSSDLGDGHVGCWTKQDIVFLITVIRI